MEGVGKRSDNRRETNTVFALGSGLKFLTSRAIYKTKHFHNKNYNVLAVLQQN